MRMRTSAAQAARKTVGYVRVSTGEQASSGLSLAAQEGRIRSFSEALGWELGEIVSDAGESAKTLQRPGVSRVLNGIASGTVERVVVLKLDRITRSVRDLSTLLELFAKRKASLVSVGESLDTESAAGRLVVNMLGVIGQWEREAIGERTTMAFEHKRNNKLVYGPVPFGWKRENEQLIPDERTLNTLGEMVRLDNEGRSYREIARILEAAHVPTRNGGGRWHASSVRSILRSRAVVDLMGLRDSSSLTH